MNSAPLTPTLSSSFVSSDDLESTLGIRDGATRRRLLDAIVQLRSTARGGGGASK